MTRQHGDTTRLPGLGHVSNNEILMTGLNGIMAGTVGFLADGVVWAIIATLIMLAVPLVPVAIAMLRASRPVTRATQAMSATKARAIKSVLILASRMRTNRKSVETTLSQLAIGSLPMPSAVNRDVVVAVRTAVALWTSSILTRAPVALPLLAILGVATGTALYGIEVAFYAALLMVPVMLTILLALVVTE